MVDSASILKSLVAFNDEKIMQTLKTILYNYLEFAFILQTII
jgi:hypothetical protein